MEIDDQKERSIIGILGGMGPEATLECFKSIIDQTPARTDQEHVHILVDNNPQIPDRTEAILNKGESPLPLLQKSAKRLEAGGADFLIIPCNTAHHYLTGIAEVIDIPILNMVRSTIEEAPPGKCVGLLATSGTINTGIYEKYAQDSVNIVYPDDSYQQKVMNVIYGEDGIKAGIKSSYLTDELKLVVDHLRDRGAETIIAGCTEIRLVLQDSDLSDVDLLTPIDIIAKRAIDKVAQLES